MEDLEIKFYFEKFLGEKKKEKFKKKKKNDGRNWTCGYRKNSLLAGYPHVSFYSNIEFFKYLIEEL